LWTLMLTQTIRKIEGTKFTRNPPELWGPVPNPEAESRAGGGFETLFQGGKPVARHARSKDSAQEKNRQKMVVEALNKRKGVGGAGSDATRRHC